MNRLQAHRSFYADLVTEAVGVGKGPAREAFATIPREHFVGKGPWDVTTGAGYVQTPSDDPAFLYQDILVALAEAKSINNGQPSLRALLLAALEIQEGETAVHVGAGSGLGGRLLFPLTPAAGFGGMLLVTAGADAARWKARFLTRAMFIPCLGARKDETAKSLSVAFEQKSIEAVCALRRDSCPDDTCWVAGDVWWLSTAKVLRSKAR